MRTILGGLLLLLWTGVCQAADETVNPVALAHTEARTISSKLTGHPYRLSVFLPANYAESGRHYPVLYVLDGLWNFSFLHGLDDTLFYAKRVPEIIIVAIDYPTDSYAEVMKSREHDFTPTAWSKRPGSGGAATYLAFLEKELIPFIDATYRTDAADRALLGHSYGGLFGIYAWMERPGLFQRILAASPSIYWDDERLIKEASERIKTARLSARLDVSIGLAEDPEDVDAVKAFDGLLKAHPPAAGAYRCTYYPGENHNSTKPLAFVYGLPWIYKN